MHGTEQNKHVLIECNEDTKNVISLESLQRSVKRHALPCHDITAFSDPAHAHEIITKTLKVVEKISEPSSGSVKSYTYTPPVPVFRLIQGKRSGQISTPAKRFSHHP